MAAVQTVTGYLLGQRGPHATEQSQGQSRATAQADATQGANKSHELVTQANRERHDKPNVHAVMVPMAQPIGGWHVTSMTGCSRLAQCPMEKSNE